MKKGFVEAIMIIITWENETLREKKCRTFLSVRKHEVEIIWNGVYQQR